MSKSDPLGRAGEPFADTPTSIMPAPAGISADESSPAWWAPNGFAAIPTTALDPPHSAASPAVPALIGSGSPSFAVPNPDARPGSRGASSRCCLQLCDLLKLNKNFAMVLHQVTPDARIPEKVTEIALGQNEVEMVGPV